MLRSRDEMPPFASDANPETQGREHLEENPRIRFHLSILPSSQMHHERRCMSVRFRVCSNDLAMTGVERAASAARRVESIACWQQSCNDWHADDVRGQASGISTSESIVVRLETSRLFD
jgi:hypothetical protein